MCKLIGKASLGCVLSSKLEKTSTQPGNDSIIAEVPAGAKNEAERKEWWLHQRIVSVLQKNKVIDRKILIKFIKTLDLPPMGQCPLNIYNLIYVTDSETSDCACQFK